MGVALVIADRTSRHAVPRLCGGFVSLHRHHRDHVCGRPGALDRRAHVKGNEGRTAKPAPARSISSGLIAAGGVFGLLGILINLFQDPEIADPCPRMVCSPSASSLAPGPLCLGTQTLALDSRELAPSAVACTVAFWPVHVLPARGIALPFRSQKTELRSSNTEKNKPRSRKFAASRRFDGRVSTP